MVLLFKFNSAKVRSNIFFQVSIIVLMIILCFSMLFLLSNSFMSIVGPSGCGKTEFLFRMLKGSNFYPRFEKIYYFYREFQPLFKDMQRVIPGIEFLIQSGFDITKN